MSSYRTIIKVGEFLFEAGKSLFAETELDKLLPLAMDKVIEHTKAQRGMIIVYGPQGEPLFEVARDHQQKIIKQPEEEYSTTVVQRVRESGEYVVIKNALEDPSIDKSQSISRLNILSVAAAPLRHNEEIIGVIYIDNRERKAIFDDETGVLLSEFAVLISVAVKNALELRKSRERQRELQDALEGYGEIIGSSQTMEEIYKLIERVAATDATVLITGESGTGKELIARALHRKSGRRNPKPVTLNCAELVTSLSESELFGIEEKTATGVKKHLGFIERANGGTLFIDEVGDIPMNIQVKLLRVLQERSLRRAGADEEIPIDLRIVAATNRNLEELIKQGQFREDLFYRLRVIEIKLPPLRERGEDIMLLAQTFMLRFAKKPNRSLHGISKAVEELLLRYHWPGNVRELENVMLRAVVLCEGSELQPKDLPTALHRDKSSDPPPSEEKNYNLAKLKWEHDFLSAHLRETKGNVPSAASMIGMHKRNLYQKLKQHGIDYKNFS